MYEIFTPEMGIPFHELAADAEGALLPWSAAPATLAAIRQCMRETADAMCLQPDQGARTSLRVVYDGLDSLVEVIHLLS
ncbi:MAG: hypothetical protein EOO28_25380 [Comamonadaceae bacterium]|nr:MAG: hypothetical protein EOO28_25380 [Comamonadaceae bacterium]